MSVDVKFTCNTCGLGFYHSEDQRDHMRTEWHRYNLKRRVAELPPVPLNTFNAKMKEQSRIAQGENEHVERQMSKKTMRRMQKQRQYEEHLKNGSSKVLPAMPNNGKANDQAPENSNEDEIDKFLREKQKTMVIFPTNQCFMDDNVFASTQENLMHLENTYGMVVPEERFVSDFDGLVTYLNEKVGIGNCCLSCPFIGRSLESVRKHMIDKNHVRIPFDTVAHLEELADFYDFEKYFEAEKNQPYTSDGYTLELGQGRSAGHRALMRYFRQRITSQNRNTSDAERPQRATTKQDNYGPGISGRMGEAMTRKAEKLKEQQRTREVKLYSNYQPHFRDQLLQ